MRMTNAVLLALAMGAVPTPGLGQDFETTEIADGVFQFRWMGHNAMIVVSGEEVVVFDPINVDASTAMVGEIRRIVPNAQLAGIVYSHSDADHSTGAAALMAGFDAQAAPIIAQERAVAPIVERGDPDQPVPNVTFAERLSFEVGGRSVQVHYLGPSHTDNMAVGFVPDAGVAFAVDFIAKDRMGYQDLPGWAFPEFFDAVAGMLRLPFETVVFGHGPPGDRASILRQVAYYDALTAAVRGAVNRGLTEDQMAAEIALPDYAHWDEYDTWFVLNARGVYRWLASEAR